MSSFPEWSACTTSSLGTAASCWWRGCSCSSRPRRSPIRQTEHLTSGGFLVPDSGSEKVDDALADFENAQRETLAVVLAQREGATPAADPRRDRPRRRDRGGDGPRRADAGGRARGEGAGRLRDDPRGPARPRGLAGRARRRRRRHARRARRRSGPRTASSRTWSASRRSGPACRSCRRRTSRRPRRPASRSCC